MNVEGNGHSSSAHLPATPEPGPPSGPGQPAPDARTSQMGAPGRLDLADFDRRGRWERQMRQQLAERDHWMQTRVRHPDGGDRTVADTLADEEEQRQQITQDSADGSRQHRRLTWWQRQIPKLVMFFDAALLLYFFAGITNVNWQNPLSMNLAFAIALAAMVTVLSYGFLAFTGYRMRSYKNHAGSVHLDEVDGFTKAAFGTATTVIAVIAALMFFRIRGEVTGALGPQAGVTALVIPLAVAVVSAVANYLVILIHALDGSDEVARLNKLAAATRGPARKAHRLQWRAVRRAQW